MYTFLQLEPTVIICVETGVVYSKRAADVRINTGYAFTDIRTGYDILWTNLLEMCRRPEYMAQSAHPLDFGEVEVRDKSGVVDTIKTKQVAQTKKGKF